MRSFVGIVLAAAAFSGVPGFVRAQKEKPVSIWLTDPSQGIYFQQQPDMLQTKDNPNPQDPVITIDEKTYEGGNDGDYHPMSWYHSYDGGRAFYTALGHTDESYSDPLYLKHLLGGIEYAIGKRK